MLNSLLVAPAGNFRPGAPSKSASKMNGMNKRITGRSRLTKATIRTTVAQRGVILFAAMAALQSALFSDQSLEANKVRITREGEARRIVTDAGAGGYQAFPDVCRLPDTGELLCVFYAGYGHVSLPNQALPRGGRICAIRSTDEGQTWSEPFVIVDTPDDDRDPSICALPDGTLLCNFFTYDQNKAFDTCLARSKDGGKTWSAPEVILPGYATSTPVRRLRSGRLLLPVYYAQTDEKRSFAAVCLSDDNAQSWSAPRAIGLKAQQTLDETDLFERQDGTLLAIMRQVMAGAESKDGGRTWGEVYNLGFAGHSPYLLETKSGVLLLAHRLPQTSLHFSLDEGRTWHGPVPIDDVIGAYPSLVNLHDGRVLCVYYEEGNRSAIRARILRVAR